MKDQKQPLPFSKQDVTRMESALECLLSGDPRELLLDAALGFKSQAMHKSYEGWTTEQLEDEYTDQRSLLEFLILAIKMESATGKAPRLEVTDFINR